MRKCINNGQSLLGWWYRNHQFRMFYDNSRFRRPFFQVWKNTMWIFDSKTRLQWLSRRRLFDVKPLTLYVHSINYCFNVIAGLLWQQMWFCDEYQCEIYTEHDRARMFGWAELDKKSCRAAEREKKQFNFHSKWFVCHLNSMEMKPFRFWSQRLHFPTLQNFGF